MEEDEGDGNKNGNTKGNTNGNTNGNRKKKKKKKKTHNMNLPTLWKKRQTAVRHAEARASSEVELLRERLNDTEHRLHTAHQPMMEELKLLRARNDSTEDQLQSSQQLWEDERRRFVEQIDVMDERVRLSERSVEEKIEMLVSECHLISNIRQTVDEQNEEWTKRKQAEQQNLENRREAVEDEYDTYMEQHARDMHTLQSNVVELADSFEQLTSLTTTIHGGVGGKNAVKEMKDMQQKCVTLEETLEMERLTVTQKKRTNQEMNIVSSDEMKAYRNKFHHMRRVATEQQASLTAEKRALLNQIEQISSTTGQTNHAKAIAEHFGKQLGVAEEARHVEREAARKEVLSLRAALSKERERTEKRARQHARELANQMSMSKERIQAEERLMVEKREVEENFKSTEEFIDSKTSS